MEGSEGHLFFLQTTQPTILRNPEEKDRLVFFFYP